MPSSVVGDHANDRNLNEAKLRRTCDACKAIKTRCSREKPSCGRCLAQNIPCNYSISRRIGRPRRLAPPPSPAASPLYMRRADKQIPVTSQASSEIGCVSQPTNQFYTVDWGGVDNDRMITENSEALSNSSNDAMESQRSQNDSLVTPSVGQAPIANMAASPVARTSGLNDQDLFQSFLGSTDFSRLSSSTPTSSGLTHLNAAVSEASLGKHINDIEVPSNHTAQQSLEDSDVDRQSSSLHNFGQQIENSQFAFSPNQRELDASGPFSWEFSNEALLPVRASACRCLESALSVTLSIGQGHVFPHPGAMDLALDVESQLRESVPLAVQCSVCKARRGEILKLFSNAMADAVDLLQQLCNAEFSVNRDSLASRPRESSILDGLEWLQAKPSGRSLSNSNQLIGSVTHERGIPTTHATAASLGTSNGSVRRRAEIVNGTSSSLELPCPPKTSRDVSNDHGQTNTELSGWHMLVGRHLIEGDDRKFMLMHLLRRRLCGLSNVLESLIRAMQDLRTALRHVDSFMLPYDDNALNRAAAGADTTAAEVVTRKSMKTAAKLYDIIDHLERIHI